MGFPQHVVLQQERLSAIVENSDGAIISKDLNGIIRSWNRGAERIFGYAPGEIIGRHISTLAVPERIDEIPDILSHLARGERVDHYQTKRYRWGSNEQALTGPSGVVGDSAQGKISRGTWETR